MEKKINISNKMVCNDPNLVPLCGHFHQFESNESWAWFVDGCPGGKSRWIPGILDRMKIHYEH